MKEVKNETEITDNLPLYSLTVGQFKALMSSLPSNISYPPAAPLEELMKLKDVLSLLKISRSGLFSWKKQGIIKGYTIRGTLFFKKSEIMQLFETNKLKNK